MKTPVGFHELCSGLHQDAMLFAGGSIDKLGADCVDFVRSEHRRELKAFLFEISNELTAAEMRSLIKREKQEITFRKSAAQAFLRAALNTLE